MGQLQLHFANPEEDTPEIRALIAPARRGISGTFRAAVRGGAPIIAGTLTGGPAGALAAFGRASQQMRARAAASRVMSPQLRRALAIQRARAARAFRRMAP